jgi:tyrosyl-tRNA synthetase
MHVFGKSTQVCITTPLLEGVDGIRKMSKSFGNAIGILETPDEMFGKIMSIPDSILPKFCDLMGTNVILTGFNPAEHPRDCKMALAVELVSKFHGLESSIQAKERFEKVFVRKEIPDDIPEFNVSRGLVWLPKLLVDLGFVKTTSEGRRVIRDRGVKINSTKVELDEFDAQHDFTIQCGKRKAAHIIIGI